MAPKALNVLLPREKRRGRIARAVIGRPVNHGDATKALDDYAANHADVAFVQIGSHDGQAGDPLTAYLDRLPGWHGTMVEPVPVFFELLAERRGADPRFRLVQAAITAHDTPTVQMTSVPPSDDLPDWTRQLSSLHRDVLLRHAPTAPGLEAHLEDIDVVALTFDELMDGAQSVDLIHIDTEGHDADVLELIDFDAWQPALVMFEHKHLSPRVARGWHRRLRHRGYEVTWNDADTVAVRREHSPTATP